MGSENNAELTFIDIISILSFVVGIQNLDYNISQEDFQNATAKLDATINDGINKALLDIHGHLEEQDRLLKEIAERLKK